MKKRNTKLKTVLRAKLITLAIGLLVLVGVGVQAIRTSYAKSNEMIEQIDSLNLVAFQRQEMMRELNEERQLTYEMVDDYIHEIAPGTKVTGKAIVDACLKHNIDIRLVIAQGIQESHMGTAGVAKKTNSPWNVNAWDGRSASDMNRSGHGYRHPNDAIEPYIILVKSNYLVNGKTEWQLVCNYVNKNGKRYASATNYEPRLKNQWKRIPKEISQSFKRCKTLHDTLSKT